MTQANPEYPPLPSGNDPAALLTMPRWNWGAFLMTWMWAWGHRMWLTLVLSLFTPIVGNIVLGLSGSQLAWRFRSFAGIEEFRKVQRAWAKWGIVYWALVVILWLVVASLMP